MFTACSVRNDMIPVASSRGRLSLNIPNKCEAQRRRWVLAKIDWLSSRANNVKGGRRNTSTRTVEPDAPAGGGDQHNVHAAHACIP